ncbi:MAG: (Fe-S)-binding protein [Chloroflexi bacterium]|nr:(Fe-S)-binding protein [Chloroflexota bacterium]
MAGKTTAVKASLFVTCIIDQLYPDVGESVVRVLRRLGVDLDFPRGQTCCGQPAFNSGFWRDAKPLARRFLAEFQGDRYIVVPSGSCASMLRVFYSELLHDEPELREKASAMSSRVFEFTEFIVDVLGVTDLAPYCGSAGGMDTQRVTYHEACHLLRELGVNQQPRMLLASLPSVEVVGMEQAEVCCGFGGTFSVKYPDISGAMLADKVDNVLASGADILTACDSSCLMQMAGGLEKRGANVGTAHVAQILDKAMRR